MYGIFSNHRFCLTQYPSIRCSSYLKRLNLTFDRKKDSGWKINKTNAQLFLFHEPVYLTKIVPLYFANWNFHFRIANGGRGNSLNICWKTFGLSLRKKLRKSNFILFQIIICWTLTNKLQKIWLIRTTFCLHLKI